MSEDTYEVDEILDELKNEPHSVKDILKEMKNISELMVDLAYSAILFNNDQLAEEVHDLEEEMNKLRYQLEIETMVSARTIQQAAELEGIIRVAGGAERISNAAQDLANLVLRDIKLHPVLKQALEEADEIVDRIIPKSGSKIVGLTVGVINQDKKHGKIIAVKRGKQWLLPPHDEDIIAAGDHVIMNAYQQNMKYSKNQAKK